MHARIALAVLLVLGLSACSAADEATPTPTAGGISTGVLDVGGYSLDWMCEGEGSPAIIAQTACARRGTSATSRSRS